MDANVNALNASVTTSRIFENLRFHFSIRLFFFFRAISFHCCCCCDIIIKYVGITFNGQHKKKKHHIAVAVAIAVIVVENILNVWQHLLDFDRSSSISTYTYMHVIALHWTAVIVSCLVTFHNTYLRSLILLFLLFCLFACIFRFYTQVYEVIFVVAAVVVAAAISMQLN